MEARAERSARRRRNSGAAAQSGVGGCLCETCPAFAA